MGGHNLVVAIGSGIDLCDLLKPHLSPAPQHWKRTRVSAGQLDHNIYNNSKYADLSCLTCHQHYPTLETDKSTVLCKSNANEFRQNSWLFVAFWRNFAWNDISTKSPRIFVTPIVLIRAIFLMIIRFARWFIPNFRAIIRASRKVKFERETMKASLISTVPRDPALYQTRLLAGAQMKGAKHCPKLGGSCYP